MPSSVPLISILIPVYNCEPYLDQCISSIINQDYKNLQIVFVNDGSTDKSLEILRKYENHDKRIKVITRENKGVGTTRNELLDEIQGEYFLFVDADDWIEPNMVSNLISLIQNHEADIVVCSKCNSNKDEKIESIEIWNKEQVIKEFLYHNVISGALWNKLIKSTLINGIKFKEDIFYGEDALFIWTVLQKITKIIITNIQLYHQTINPYSLSNSIWTPKKQGTGHKVWEIISQETKEKWPQYIKIAHSSFAINDMWMIYFAGKANYPYDEYIRLFQASIKANYKFIKEIRSLDFKHRAFALLASRSYFLSKVLVKFI